MNTTQEPHQNCKLQMSLSELRRNVHVHAPALGALLDLLDEGIMPTPIEVMLGISESVAYFTEGVPSPGESRAQCTRGAPGFCPMC